ncbi:MAG: type 4a pilus biogenesis protein PilO [Desulfobulbaceae bacterium]|nr:type 4a pilus biogenesis protein PilO [Desulfobulbaceae bacterium]
MSIDKVRIQEAVNTFLDEKVAPLKTIHKAGILTAFIVLPCVAFYFISFSPNSDKIKRLRSQKNKLEQEIAKVEKAASQIKKYRAEMAESELMFAKASSLLPQKQEIPSLLTSISDLGQGSGLDFLSFTPGGEKRQEFYADIPVAIKVRGPYHNVGVFLDRISKLSRIVTVSNLSMGGPKKQAGEMMLDTNFTLVTYRFIETTPEVKGKKRKR